MLHVHPFAREVAGRLALSSLLVALLVAAPATALADSGSIVLSPDTAHYGKTYRQWSAAWWERALSIPIHSPPFSSSVNHPLVDLSGARCGVGQANPVWFLGGAFFQNSQLPSNPVVITRNDCTVPSSAALFFPFLNIECSLLEGSKFGCADSVDGLRSVVGSIIDQTCVLTLEVDGTSVPIPLGSHYRVGSPTKPLFGFTLPPDDVLSFIGEGPFKPGNYSPAVDDGYYAMLAPLSKGKHVVRFVGGIFCDASGIPGFELDVTYNLTVR